MSHHGRQQAEVDPQREEKNDDQPPTLHGRVPFGVAAASGSEVPSEDSVAVATSCQ
jgi:hypothetical protein